MHDTIAMVMIHKDGKCLQGNKINKLNCIVRNTLFEWWLNLYLSEDNSLYVYL